MSAAAVDALLADWLPAQRWFGGKGRPIAKVESSASVLADGDPAVWIHVVAVQYVDGGRETYFVPLSLRSGTTDTLAYALIGETATLDEGAPVFVHDALHDRDTTPVWTRLLAEGARVGPTRFVGTGAAVPTDVPGDALTVEQSNTSLVYGEAAIVKFFRRIEPGVHPDVEIHAALLPTGNPHVVPLLGHVTVERPGADDTWTVAMAQAFLPAASDGWALATASVRDLYAEGDLHPDEVGGDFAAESHRLGAATASVHADLAEALGELPAAPDWLPGQIAVMRARLAEASEVLPELAGYADAIEAAYEALADTPVTPTLQRIHGDLHLGQVLRTATGWTLLDFEGEPARPLAERREPHTPLRDVACMLRSFDYAARWLLVGGPEDPQLAYRATEWAGRNRAAFCDGYGEASGRDPRADAELLRALELDKAVYEALYETRHRPAWVAIPLRSLDRLLR